jgi:hypothetical protein
MRHVLSLALVLILAALAAPASAQIAYQPLAPGCAWTYTDGAGHERVVEAVGPAVIQGENVVELAWTEPDQVYHNFWSQGPTGAVYLHAAYNEDGVFVASYSPPILWLPAVAATERCWSTTTRIYWSLDDSVPFTEATLTYCVTDGGVLTVPAGDFDAVAVTSSTPPLQGARGAADYDVQGRRFDSAVRQAEPSWYAAGVGLVKEGAWELTTYGGPTPFVTSNWGEVKALYR